MALIERHEIESTQTAILEDVQGRQQLLVSFGGIRQGMGIPVFEFYNSIKHIDCDKIFIRDFNQAWYHKGLNTELKDITAIANFLKEKINIESYSRVVFIGNSMGAYAAILFGVMCDVDHVVAFSPQSYIDKFRRFIFRDRRWKQELSQVYSHPGTQRQYFDLRPFLRKAKYNCSIHIYYSSSLKLDKKHAERLSEIEAIKLHPNPDAGHTLVKYLRDQGLLNSIIENCFR